QGTNKTTMNNKAAFANIISAVAAVSYHDYEGKAERRPQMVFCVSLKVGPQWARKFEFWVAFVYACCS
ncbi:hypothetical protein, partial [Lacticaseibacillus nasuensis]|uniref:hypothetical protein n=1 Tax=Lacticaseibacillus nasuensis TaxID=944671 RepID=UPI00224584BF